MNTPGQGSGAPEITRRELEETIDLVKQNMGIKDDTLESGARVALKVVDSFYARERDYQRRRAEVFLFALQRAFEEVNLAKRPVSMGYLQSLHLKCGWGAIDKFLREHPDVKRSVHKNKVYFTYKGVR
jgi:hypothetical protein